LRKDKKKIVENNEKYFELFILYRFFYCNKKIANNRQKLLRQPNIKMTFNITYVYKNLKS